MAAMQRHWDIFCRVVDNFGDIGVCWRLARQLAGEHGLQVRLWVDEPESLQPLCPAFDQQQERQVLQGVEIRRWHDEIAFGAVADVVVEAFACELPPAYIEAMAQRPSKPCWLNLEYLSAEDWIKGCHGMASPHPSMPLTKYFVFPGFFRSTAGLLREADLLPRRDHFLASLPSDKPFEISLFCYDTAPIGDLLKALADTPIPLVCYVPPGKPLMAVRQYLAGDGPWLLGQARIQPIPFLSMDDYDALLWRCDVNFVRGEDSFVRAQWAERPFVWQVYPQDEDAHLEKLTAFLGCYCEGADAATAHAIRALFVAWNTGENLAETWAAFLALRREIERHNRNWCQYLNSLPDLAFELVTFCASKV